MNGMRSFVSGNAMACCLFVCGCACLVLSGYSRSMTMGEGGQFSEEGLLDQKVEFAVSVSSLPWAIEDGDKPPRAIEVLEEGN